jgi:large subunit ribosomal protein L21
MYAIIEQGGKQHKVTAGDRLRIDAPIAEDAKTFTFDKVLLVGGGEGSPKVGVPAVSGATVTADVVGAVKAKKVMLQKHKRRKGYTRKQGHRQNYTEVVISAINV